MLYADLVARLGGLLADAVDDDVDISDSALRQCLLFFVAKPFALANIRTLCVTPAGTLIARWGDGGVQEFTRRVPAVSVHSLASVELIRVMPEVLHGT